MDWNSFASAWNDASSHMQDAVETAFARTGDAVISSLDAEDGRAVEWGAEAIEWALSRGQMLDSELQVLLQAQQKAAASGNAAAVAGAAEGLQRWASVKIRYDDVVGPIFAGVRSTGDEAPSVPTTMPGIPQVSGVGAIPAIAAGWVVLGVGLAISIVAIAWWLTQREKTAQIDRELTHKQEVFDRVSRGELPASALKQETVMSPEDGGDDGDFSMGALAGLAAGLILLAGGVYAATQLLPARPASA